jgi:hypothetical protein
MGSTNDAGGRENKRNAYLGTSEEGNGKLTNKTLRTIAKCNQDTDERDTPEEEQQQEEQHLN